MNIELYFIFIVEFDLFLIKFVNIKLCKFFYLFFIYSIKG